MSLKAEIVAMDLPLVRPEVTSQWLRSLLRLPPLPKQPTGRLIESFNFEAKQGEVLTLVGPSATGKTTLLRILCGLERRFNGQVTLDGNRILKPQRRIYLLPQQHTLLDWFTVERNLLFFARRDDEIDPRETVDKILDRLRLTDKRHAYPIRLSGGERARVALGCAMAAGPDVLLLDEPFRGLDQVASERIQQDLVDWLQQTERKEAVVIVSHSVADAVFLGDRVIVVRGGPLSVHAEIPSPRPKKRLSAALLKVEIDVLKALEQAAAQQ